MESIQDFTTIHILSNDIYQDILLLPENRRGFGVNNGVVTLPVFFYRVIGIEHDNEREYYNDLYNMDIQLKKLGNVYQKFDLRLDTFVTDDMVGTVSRIWNEINADTNLRASYITANFFGAGILKFTNNAVKDLQIRKAFETCLDTFATTQKHAKNPSIVKNFCIKILFWFEKYALSMFKSYQTGKHNPKFLFYNEMKRDEIYFMIFLSRLGFDILYFNSFSNADFDEIDPESKYSVKLEFNKKMPNKPFPTAESIVTIETSAYQAERSIETTVNAENVNLFKPRQFEECNVKSIPLKTTYEELFTLWNNEARYRNGFRVYNNTVYIPNIFVKVNGTHRNLAAYWTNILKLVKEQGEYVYMIDSIPFSKPSTKTVDYKTLLTNNSFFDKEKVKSCKDYTLSYLKTPIQDLLLDKANELIQKEYFKFSVDFNMKTKILSALLNLDKEIIKLLQRFDYPFFVPKLFIYDKDEKTFSVEDYITLAFLNAVGIDIAIFSPTGYNNIENGIKSGLFDIHNLEEVKFDLGLSKEVSREVKKRQPRTQESIMDLFKNWLK